MVLQNFTQLATTPLRQTALEIVEAGYEAIRTDRIIKQNVRVEGNVLHINSQIFDLDDIDNVYIVAFGKSSYEAAKTLDELLGNHITDGFAIGVTKDKDLLHIKTIVGTHPSPSETNVQAAQEIINLLEKTTERDLVVAVISGGGSALFAAPYNMDVQTQAAITDTLMKSGADIHELNIVRKHISRVKGGRLAALTYPAQLVALIFSDVPGNDLATIASGPTVLDPSTLEEARRVLEKYDIYEKLRLETIPLAESPKDTELFSHVTNLLVLDPESAVRAMEQKAKQMGWRTRILSTTLEGEAGAVGRQLLQAVRPGEILLASGETTVNVKGHGKGGRNQELVLANLQNIKPGQVILSAASDGHDNSESAGAIADHLSYRKAKDNGINPEEYLANNDSYPFFQTLGDSLQTGVLDSNIADMYVVLWEEEKV